MDKDEKRTEENNEGEYVNTPQNDLRQIDQIAREYGGYPAKGIAHGLQKDAIQNGVGARVEGKEKNAYRNWKFKFKLFEIDGKFALSFADEGTTGLTGDILPIEDINRLSVEGKLTQKQKLSRFLTRFESGGNTGPGSFGRGKLIFQAASKDFAILCDSLRLDDRKYIAFERKISGNSLIQSKMPLQGAEAIEFIEKKSQGCMEPLQKSGTRVTILNLRDEIVEEVKNSFREDGPEKRDDYPSSFIHMIEETWWEIISKFDAEISLEYNGKTKNAELNDPLKSIVSGNGNESDWEVYKDFNMPVVVKEENYKIKEIRLVLSPDPLEEDFRGVWIQRKRMKIGNIKGISPHSPVMKKISGYVTLDEDLEEEIEKSENTTHYSFNFTHSAPIQIRQKVKQKLEEFQENLGIRIASSTKDAQQSMRNAMKEINDKAEKLGLLSEFNAGSQSKDLEISIDSFKLPNEGSKRIDFGDEIGPIIYKIKNNSSRLQEVELFVTAEQRGKGIKTLHKKDIEIGPSESESVVCNKFIIDESSKYENCKEVTLLAKVNDRNSGEKICSVSRKLWLGGGEPENEANPVSVTAYKPEFPRAKSNRVEWKEAIKNIRFKISNQSPFDIRINMDLLARQVQIGNANTLKEMQSQRDFLLKAMSDEEFAEEALIIEGGSFRAVEEGPASPEHRKCDIYFNVRLARNMSELDMRKGEKLEKRKIEFYVGSDPPGRSVFNKLIYWHDPKDGRRSRHRGDRAAGYSFLLNAEHPSYKIAQIYELEQKYTQEQMLRQAYAIAIMEKGFEGFSEDLNPSEIFLKFEEIVGKAIIAMD